ncbi:MULTISPECIES: tRNA 2-thiouridine(34) synthase MnmA [Dictyoglomus]|uniref:tRNA 2-thiouridine(34) synthase MnmA n=1 Tax=Dictyoglomus TaxID=13 RepID=UPI0023570A20|nr:tRNA 2-thiouridine(34) synthase MnmA [Dictyoglomus turgidum]
MLKRYKMSIKVAVGMSGGVDSSITAYLLKKEGYEVIGLTMNIAYSSSIKDAKKVAEYLNIPHFFVDLKKEFEEKIIKYFVESYKHGYTPNPCVFCNKLIKFGLLLEKAKELGADFLSTGHYVRKVWDEERKTYLLMRAKDLKKDQSYFLGMLTQEQIKKTLFPLGELTKEEVRKIADELGIFVANKKESQDICFLPDKDYKRFLSKYLEDKPGKIITEDGKEVGYHSGVFSFTIGQRRGLRVALGVPVYVKDIDPNTGNVTVTDREKVFGKEVYAVNVNYPSYFPEKRELRAYAMIRYNMKPSPGVLKIVSEKEVLFIFDDPQWAITPGQILVCYLDNHVLCAGIIERK